MAKVLMLGTWGVDKDVNWDMGEIDASTTLKEVAIGHDPQQVIHSLSFTYEVGGQVKQYRRVGGDWASIDKFTLASGEYIKYVRGFTRNYAHPGYIPYYVVSSLTFVTSEARTFGPYGKEEGDPFSLPVHNGKIIGLFGAAGQFIDSIGFYAVPV